ncbi:MAG: hypothetical protein ACFFB6_06045 [Promethearchaeota archaeon]
MDITKFNKELANKITIAKRFEKNGDTKAAIQVWLEISEMTISYSKNQKLEASFRNMLMNRVRGIFAHIKSLKSGQYKGEMIMESAPTYQEAALKEPSSEIFQIEDEELQRDEKIETATSSSNIDSDRKIIEDSNLKNLPEGFKEIETSEDFEIITPHDKNFVKKQLDKALDREFFKSENQGTPKEPTKQQKRLDLEQHEKGKNKICFACGYDKNLITDKICKNCGTNLN